MAARRAGSGVTGLAVATILFVILWVVSTALAIVFYTQVSEARNEAAAARQERERLALDEQLRDPFIVALTQDDQLSGPVIGRLLADRNALAQAIIENPRLNARAIITQLEESHGVARGETLVRVVTGLRAELQHANERGTQLTRERDTAQARVAALDTANRELKQTFDAEVARQVVRLESQKADIEAAKREAGTRFTSLDQQIQQKQEEVTQIQRRSDDQVRQLELQIAEQRATIARLLRDLGKEGLLVPTERLPDGRILSVSQEDRVAYINLGRANHLPLGLTFEVYDRKTGVTQDEFGDWRGKATVEVVRIEDNTATTRIIRQRPGTSINEGDVVQNLVYDPQVPFRFHVFGRFDIDHIGRPTDTDRRRVLAMIEDWNGILDEELTYRTDFLVLGMQPDFPEPLDDLETRPEVIAEHAQRMRDYQNYQNLIGRANEMKIPVLNQTRFLVLVGYFQR
jgi:hypothetical protein